MLSKRIFSFLVFIFLIKLLLANFVPLFSDEAYYWVWSNHIQLSYFDHPGMVAWLIKIGILILPKYSFLSVRFLFVILSTLTLWIWCKLIKNDGGADNKVIIFLLLICLNPLLGLGSILATPDVPLVFFWSLSFYSFNKILTDGRRSWYAALGVFLGMGFLSKYHIVLFVICGLLYLLISKNYKKIKISGVFLTLIFGFVFSLPVLIWNYQNNWSSFFFQLNHGFGRTNYNFEWTISYIFGQFLLISPFVFINLFQKPVFRINKIFSISQLIFFLSSSFKSVVEANWPITSHLHAVNEFVYPNNSNHKKTFFYWIFIYIIIGLIFLIPSQRQKIFSSQKNTFSIQDLANDLKSYAPLYGPTYQVSSLLSWSLQRPVSKLNGLSRFDFFDTLPEAHPTEKEFYVLRNANTEWPEMKFIFHFRKIKNYPELGLELFRVTRSDEINE